MPAVLGEVFLPTPGPQVQCLDFLPLPDRLREWYSSEMRSLSCVLFFLIAIRADFQFATPPDLPFPYGAQSLVVLSVRILCPTIAFGPDRSPPAFETSFGPVLIISATFLFCTREKNPLSRPRLGGHPQHSLAITPRRPRLLLSDPLALPVFLLSGVTFMCSSLPLGLFPYSIDPSDNLSFLDLNDPTSLVFILLPALCS